MAAEIVVLRVADNTIADRLQLPGRVRFTEMKPETASHLVSGDDPFSGRIWQTKVSTISSLVTGSVRMSPDVVLLDCQLTKEQAAALSGVIAPYRVFYTRRTLVADAATDAFLRRKMAGYVDPADLEAFLASVPGSYWKGQYGNQLTTSRIEVNPHFDGLITYCGHSAVELSGTFGRELLPVVCWRQSIPMNYPEKSIDFWPEIHTEGRVRARFCVTGFSGQEGDLPQYVWEFDSGIREPFHFDKKADLQLSVELLAEGRGIIRIGSLHYRDSRNGAGYLLPGGRRYCDANGEELFAYYDPGDGRGPLNVYFCEGNGQERFHGLRLMQTFGGPVLMLLDTRLSNGKYYIGTPEYEAMVLSVIRERMAALGLVPEELILSGTSSGAYGALHYGCVLRPRAIILGKPLLNPGNIARGERLRHPGVYGESLDVLLDLTGSVSTESAEQLDRKLWERIDSADFSRTRFAVVYMAEDDLDPTAYRDLLLHMEQKKTVVYGKGIEGRHEDSREQERQWFYLVYRKILMEEFGREPKMAL